MILSSSLSVFSSSIQVVSTEGYSCNLSFFNRTMPCSLGTNGVISPDMKEEGDGKTHRGLIYFDKCITELIVFLNQTLVAFRMSRISYTQMMDGVTILNR